MFDSSKIISVTTPLGDFAKGIS